MSGRTATADPVDAVRGPHLLLGYDPRLVTSGPPDAGRIGGDRAQLSSLGQRVGMTGDSRGPSHRSVGAFVQAVVALGVAAGLGCMLARLLSVYTVRDMAFLLFGAALAGLSWLNPRFSIVAVVAAFVFSGLLRRLVPVADPVADAAALFPLLVAVPLAVYGITVRKPVAVSLLLIWAVVGVALSLRAPLVGLAGWLNLAVPLLAAFGIRRIAGGVNTFARATVICGAIAATYGIAQYFVPFSWDVAWLTRSGIRSAGVFGESSFRPFATLPAPQIAAMLCAVVILLLVFQGHLVGPSITLRVWALSSTSVLLLLTLARTVWVGLAAGLLVGLLATRGRRARQMVPLVVVAALFVFLTPQGEVISSRASTITDLSEDRSYLARLDLLRNVGSLLSPVGVGLGNLSAAGRADADRTVDTTVDNGYLVVLGELGLIGAGLLVWVLVWLVRQSRRPEYAFVTLLLVTSAGSLVFGNLPGLLLWVFSGIGLDRGKPPSEPTDGPPGGLHGEAGATDDGAVLDPGAGPVVG